MYFYPFHIGDWASHTAHLTLEEDGVFRRILDHYYDTESPIPIITKPVIRRLRLGSYEEIFGQILEEFFILEEDGWHNYRADIEIKSYHLKGDTARKNGLKGGRPKKNSVLETQPVNLANPEDKPNEPEVKLTSNHEPVTSNHEPVNTKTIRKRFTPPTIEMVSDYCLERLNTVNPEAFMNHYLSNGWLVGKNKMKDWQAAVRTWESNNEQRTNQLNHKQSRSDGIRAATLSTEF